MNWKNIIKNSKLDTVQDTTMSVKPEEREENCLRKIKNLEKKLRRIDQLPYDDFKQKKSILHQEPLLRKTVIEFATTEEFFTDLIVLGIELVGIETEQAACDLVKFIKENGLLLKPDDFKEKKYSVVEFYQNTKKTLKGRQVTEISSSLYYSVDGDRGEHSEPIQGFVLHMYLDQEYKFDVETKKSFDEMIDYINRIAKEAVS